MAARQAKLPRVHNTLAGAEAVLPAPEKIGT